MNFEKNYFLSALKCIGVTISLVVKNNTVFRNLFLIGYLIPHFKINNLLTDYYIQDRNRLKETTTWVNVLNVIGEKLIRIKSLFPLGIGQKFDIKSPQAKNFSSFGTMRLFFCFFGPSVVLATTKGNVLEKNHLRN